MASTLLKIVVRICAKVQKYKITKVYSNLEKTLIIHVDGKKRNAERRQ